MRRWSVGLVLAAVTWLAADAPAIRAQTGAPAAPGQGAARGHGQGTGPAAPAGPRINALVVSGGCCHDWITQGQILMQTVNKTLPVDWTVAYQGDRGTRSLFPVYNRADWSKGFDIVVHNECSADVTDPDFLRRITAGHPVPGI